MKVSIKVIGMGPGHNKLLTLEAIEAIKSCQIVVGSKRLIEQASVLKLENTLTYSCTLSEMEGLIEKYLKTLCEDKDEENSEACFERGIGVLASGDTGFFSIANWVKEKYESMYEVSFISGISSLQYFCNRVHKPYQDVYTMSVHGRDNQVLGEVLSHELVFVLTGGSFKVQDVCRCLTTYGLGQVQVYIGEHLSYQTEKIVTGAACEFVDSDFGDLAVILIERTQSPCYPYVTGGLPNGAFIRGQVPMTKEEVRAVILSKLQLLETDCVYDIGAGTGSVAIEMARLCKRGFVYALEQNEEAVTLVGANKEHLGIVNMEVYHTKCPEGIKHLPIPQKVFIGGSGGKLREILKLLLEKNPKVRIVLTAITLETLQESIECGKDFGLEIDCTQVSIATSNVVGDYHMLRGHNPVFILTLKGREHNE